MTLSYKERRHITHRQLDALIEVSEGLITVKLHKRKRRFMGSPQFKNPIFTTLLTKELITAPHPYRFNNEGQPVILTSKGKALMMGGPGDGEEFLPHHGHHMDIFEWIEAVKENCFIDYDGSGDYASETGLIKGSPRIRPSDVEKGLIDLNYTHIVWYNR